MRPPLRPTTVTVFAILQLIFGIMGACGGLIGFAGKAFTEAVAKAQPNNPSLAIEAELEKTLPSYTTFQMVEASLGLALGTLMIVGGTLMLQSKALGHSLTMIYGVAGFLRSLATLIFTMGFMMPAMNTALDNWATKTGAPPAAASAGKITGVVAALFGGIIGMVYPALVLYFMTRPHVKDFFAGRIPPDDRDRRPPEDEYFRDRDRPRQDDERYRDRPDPDRSGDRADEDRPRDEDRYR